MYWRKPRNKAQFARKKGSNKSKALGFNSIHHQNRKDDLNLGSFQ